MASALRLPALVLTLVVLAPAAEALAYPAGATTLLSRPSGLATLPPTAVGDSTLERFAVSADGCRIAFTSASDGLSPADDDSVTNVFVRDVCANTTTLVSRATGADGAAANAASSQAAISRDGNVVAFVSQASNLAGTTPGRAHLYVRRLDTAATTLVDAPVGGVENESTSIGEPSLDADGDTIAFRTHEPDLAGENVPGAFPKVYVRRLGPAPTTVLASRATGETAAAADGASRAPSLDASGRFVAFESEATNLVDGDSGGHTDVFVRDLQDHTTALVSRAGLAGAGGTNWSGQASISGDGTKVAFTSRASNLVSGDAGGFPDVIVRTLASGTNVIASRATGAAGAQADYDSGSPVLDADGSTVAFRSDGRNLVPGASGPVLGRVYTRELATDTTTLVTRGANGTVPTDRDDDYVETPAVDGSGTKVAFETASDKILGGTRDDFRQVGLRDVGAGSTQVASRPAGTGPVPGADGGPVQPGNGRTVSADGRYVVFASAADGLSPADDDRFTNVFRRDLRTDETLLVSRTPAGQAGGGDSSQPAVSADGTRVAFVTFAANLGGAANQGQVVVRDLAANTLTLVSRRAGANGDPTSGSRPAISGDGTKVAFEASSLAVLGTGNHQAQVIVRDLVAATTTLASRASGADGAVAASNAGHASLDHDGSRVAFHTAAANLVAGDTTSDDDVYVRDLATSTTLHASGTAQVSHSGGSWAPSISADGEKVAFTADGYLAINRHLYVQTLGGGAVLADRDAADEPMTGTPAAPSLSADGTKVAFSSEDNATDVAQIHVRDLAAGTTTLVSRAGGENGAVADRGAGAPSISHDGDCVAFTSAATNLGPEHAGGDFRQLWYRAVGGGCAGESAPVVSLDGRSGADASTTAAFTFTATGLPARFECRLDGGAFAACTSPATRTGLTPGDHEFAVRAIDVHGNVSAIATRAFTVLGPANRDDDRPAGGGTPAVAATPAPADRPSLRREPVRRPAGAALSLASAKLTRLAGGRALGVRLRCAAATRCTGTLVVSAGRKRLGRARIDVAPGRTASIRVGLARPARRGARVTLTMTPTGGATIRATARVG